MLKLINYKTSRIILLCLNTFLYKEAFADSSKEIWLQFKGIQDCKESFCANGIPAGLLEDGLNYLKNNQNIIHNNNYLTIIDFTLNSIEKRMYILNLHDGSVDNLLVTHGKKSESELGMAKFFSNTPESEMSSVGFYVTDFMPYKGKHGNSLRLNGLSSTNSNARLRNIVIHAADYATKEFAELRGRLGLSQGCPAVDPDKITEVIKKLKGESLLYIYSDQESI